MKTKSILISLGFLFYSWSGFASISQFNGQWVNVDNNTRGITKLNIHSRGTQVSVRAYGSCSPQDCDWGAEPAEAYASKVSDNLAQKAKALSVVYDKNFAEKILIIKPAARGLLKVQEFVSFKGTRTNYTNVYTFKKKTAIRLLPDLIVSNIQRPQWDSRNRISLIKATIKNIGNKKATISIARLMDYSTLQPTGAPYNSTANVIALNPGQSQTVTFSLPYWVYNPDAQFEVTADYKNTVVEKNENNNAKEFDEIG